MKKMLAVICVLMFVSCGKNDDEVVTVIATPNYDQQSYCCVNYGNGWCGYVVNRTGEYWQIEVNGYRQTFNRNFLRCY
jgi:hypothetical protein